MAKINFRDEWISKNILILAMQNGTFNENDYLGRLIAWGETAFCIKKERENRYYIEFAGKVICTGINTFELAIDLIEQKDWDIIRVISAVMADYILWSKEQETIKIDAEKSIKEITNEIINENNE